MKNKEKSKSKIVETTTPSKSEAELTIEQNMKKKIVVKSYLEPTRPYFSSPCLLSEMENTEDTFNF
ncbi:MAG: hypothetical protein PHP53_19740 [Prolixibacteraceae bacterium]|nr:hypothetical protein [Prolixibacteraceae bacterium]